MKSRANGLVELAKGNGNASFQRFSRSVRPKAVFEERLVIDARQQLTPSQIVEARVLRHVCDSNLPVSTLRVQGAVSVGRRFH